MCLTLSAVEVYVRYSTCGFCLSVYAATRMLND